MLYINQVYKCQRSDVGMFEINKSSCNYAIDYMIKTVHTGYMFSTLYLMWFIHLTECQVYGPSTFT